MFSSACQKKVLSLGKINISHFRVTEICIKNKLRMIVAGEDNKYNFVIFFRGGGLSMSLGDTSKKGLWDCSMYNFRPIYSITVFCSDRNTSQYSRYFNNRVKTCWVKTLNVWNRILSSTTWLLFWGIVGEMQYIILNVYTRIAPIVLFWPLES